jgi:hypothetical protein
MYGTDWIMLAQIPHANRYLQNFDAAVRRSSFWAGQRDDILSGKLRRFLKLAPVLAPRIARAPELAEFGPYTSKDMDYFGRVQAEEKLADALGGTVSTPEMDDATPHTAIVEADF